MKILHRLSLIGTFSGNLTLRELERSTIKNMAKSTISMAMASIATCLSFTNLKIDAKEHVIFGACRGSVALMRRIGGARAPSCSTGGCWGRSATTCRQMFTKTIKNHQKNYLKRTSKNKKFSAEWNQPQPTTCPCEKKQDQTCLNLMRPSASPTLHS